MNKTYKHTGVYDKYGIELHPGDILGVKNSVRAEIEEFGSHLVGSFSYRPVGATNPTSSYPLYDLVKHDEFIIIGNKDVGEVNIRAISYQDLEKVEEMDEKSGFHVFDTLKDYSEDEFGNYAYGMFLQNELIGYCTVGGAEMYDCWPDYRNDDLCLSDVFIEESYRGKHLGSIMVAKAITLEFKDMRRNVFATILNDNEISFYKALGFVVIGKDTGVICKRVVYDTMTVAEYNNCFLPSIDKAKSFVDRLDSCVNHLNLDENAKQEVRSMMRLYGWSPSTEDVLIKALDCYKQHEGLNKLP